MPTQVINFLDSESSFASAVKLRPHSALIHMQSISLQHNTVTLVLEPLRKQGKQVM